MKRKNVIRNMGIISAFARGMTIQYKTLTGVWCDLTEAEGLPMGTLEEEPDNFRIKPKTTYRPYRNLKECFHDLKNHEPLGYVRHKQTGDLELIIGALDDEHEYLKLSMSHISQLNTVFERYTYFDGSPFGVNTEEE